MSTRKIRCTLWGALLGAVVLSSGVALAGDVWMGTNQNWNDAANWGGTFPTSSQDPKVNISSGNFPILSANSAFIPRDIIIANGGTNTGRFDHRAGSLSLANTTAVGNWFMIGRDTTTASGTYNLADTSASGAGISGFATGSGSVTVGKLWIGGAHFAGVGGTGTVNINTTGTITANSTQNFSSVTRASVILAFGAGSNGTVNLENGTIEANSELWVGYSGNATFNQSGGTVESTEFFVVGRNSGAVANYNLSGGSVNAVTTLANAFAVLGSFSGSQGTLNVSGGTFTVAGNRRMFVGEGGTGILNVSGTGLVTVSDTTEGIRLGAVGTGNGTVNLNGGTIQTTLVSKGAGSGTFNFNGGTLRAGGSTANFMTGLTAANVNGGGAVIDSNSFDITIAQPLLNGGGGGGLTKNNTGILTLSGSSTYTGATTINGGTLRLASTGSINNSNSIDVGGGAFFDVTAVAGYSLQNGQTLAGTGTVQGDVALATGAMLSPGTSPGTLTFANNLDLSLVGGSDNGDLIFELGTASDLVLLSAGQLSIGAGTLGFDDFSFSAGSGFGPGTYTLFQTDQSIVGGLDITNLSGLVGGYSAELSLADSSTDLVLTVVPEPAAFVLWLAAGATLWLTRRRTSSLRQRG